MRTIKISMVMIFSTLLLTSCGKPTVKSENSRFASSEKEVKGFAAIYPRFDKLLKARLTKASEAKKSAEGLKDEQAKIDAMAAARKLLTSGFVGKLSSVDSDLQKLRKDANSVANEVKSEADRLSAKTASEDALRVLKNADELLKKSVEGEDEVTAEAILTRILEEIRASKANIRKVIDSAKAASKKASTPTAKPAAGAKPGTSATKTPTANWKCKYCANANKSAITKCDSCGASR